MFRHTAAILDLKNGMDQVSLQHLLGHSDISTTRGYLEALKDEDAGNRARQTPAGEPLADGVVHAAITARTSKRIAGPPASHRAPCPRLAS
jgi:hypothetical protein